MSKLSKRVASQKIQDLLKAFYVTRDVNFICKWKSPWKLPRLEIQSWKIFPRGDGGESPPEKDLGMGTVFRPPPRGDSIPKNY
jgi:hypothetical protein